MTRRGDFYLSLGNSSLKSLEMRGVHSRTARILATMSFFCHLPFQVSPDGPSAMRVCRERSPMSIPLCLERVASLLLVFRPSQLWSLNWIFFRSCPLPVASSKTQTKIHLRRLISKMGESFPHPNNYKQKLRVKMIELKIFHRLGSMELTPVPCYKDSSYFISQLPSLNNVKKISFAILPCSCLDRVPLALSRGVSPSLLAIDTSAPCAIRSSAMFW